MLGFLPAPLGDELLYSMLARYRVLAGGVDSRQIMDAAFGNGGKYAYVVLPGRLRYLAASLPGKEWTAERLAADHTILPYFARLLPREKYERMVDGLLDGWDSGGFNGMSPTLMAVASHRFLNFCPECVAEEQEWTGMSAWHRVHQLPGVFVCPTHLVPLRRSDILASGQAKLISCVADGSDGAPLVPILEGAVAASIARNSLWLLTNAGEPTDPATVRAGVRTMLREAGWISKNNMVARGLRQALAGRLGEAALQALGCRVGIVGNRDAWVGWLWEQRDALRAHPLRYLLLLAFLDREVSDLFAFVGKALPDDEPVILKQNRPSISRRQVPERPKIIARHRARTLAALADFPEDSRTELRLKCSSIIYLARHDAAWLEAHLPPERSKATVHDWAKRDAALLPLVLFAIARLQARPGRPVRLTVSRVAIEAGESVLTARKAKLPLCTTAAEAAAEDDLAFARRRLDWAANEMVRRGGLLQWSTLATFGKLHGPWRPALEPYARELFERMLVAAPGEDLFAAPLDRSNLGHRTTDEDVPPVEVC